MERVTGTLRIDATLDDLPGQPVVSLKLVQIRKGGSLPGYGRYSLYWLDRGDWHRLVTVSRPMMRPLEDFVLEGTREAQEKGFVPTAAKECTILDVWRRVDYP